MKTQHDIEKEQAVGPEASMPPAQAFPQPPRQKRNRWVVIGAVILALALILSLGVFLIPGLIQHPASQATPTASPPTATVPTTPGAEVTTTPAQGVTPGPQPGPSGVSNPAYWDKIIGTQPGVNKVERVSFANIMGTSSLQALVTVRYAGTDARLDVYVFNDITSAHPKQLFKLAGLVKGDAKISGYNTVMTAEVDKNSSLNTGKAVSAMTPDLFREFAWSGEEGTLVQTAFPGIFPDLTRYQAEADQAQVNAGHDTWKNDPTQVAKALASQFFDWKRSITTKLLSGGGSRDVYATVQVQEVPVQGGPSQGPYVKVTLSRLEGNTHNFWVAIAAEDNTMLTLTNIEPRQLIASPVTLEGTGAAFEAVIGRAVVYDHLYSDIGHAPVTALTAGMGISAYSTKVVYTSSFRQGAQEGIVAVYENNGGISDETFTAVMAKVLLNPEPGVALGPLPCPDKVKDPSYWTPFVSAPPDIRVADSVSCGNLLGKPSLQAMVVAREILGGGPVYRSVFVFDNILAAKPTLLFSVKHLLLGDARISGYSTIMTAEVDVNSSINKDKQLTVDLFREFQWSDGAGKFVQVAFPGLYPDLTRYQAEADQARVNQGQDTWKNDPARVAKALVGQFFGWKRALTAKVLSGGGSRDVDATVQVQEAPLQGGPKQSPTVTVTLSRLEGNTHNMWVAIAVKDGADALTNIPARSLVASPVKLEGKGSAFEGVIGMAYILDHLYTPVGRAIVTGVPGVGMGNTTYSILVSYDTSFKTGPQEGIVEVQLTSPVEADPYAAVMVKVLLDPKPVVALGPVSCPLVTQQPGYWEPILGIDPNTSGVGTASCANLKGDPSLQALVPVYSTNGKPGEIYVYDHITDAQPVQLFKLQTASAMISGANTIMTADIDPNASLNKEKSADQMTMDLFREFQWSTKAGTFVQVAFPGLYPDLTRWQAEQDQRLVNAGQDRWKLDAVQTTQHALKFLNRPATNPLTLLSGGGSHDLTATVRAESFPQGAGVAATIITLSRLEGNANGGIWEITAVQSKDFGITSPPSGPSTLITSPVTVKGFGWQFEGEVGNVVILDHLYTEIGRQIARGTGGFTASSFAVDVPYTSSFQGGVQEGIVVLYENSGGGIPAVAMVKVLISA